MTAQLHFYDAANPHNVPSGVHAACYINGYSWPQSQMDRMSYVIHISVLREASWAKYARVLDIENGAGLPSDLPPFIHERRSLGFHDSTAYVNRSNWQAAWEVVKESKEPEPLWWVSTLDGTQNVELTVGGVVVAKAWAVQYYGGANAPYDLSVLHGVNNFHRP